LWQTFFQNAFQSFEQSNKNWTSSRSNIKYVKNILKEVKIFIFLKLIKRKVCNPICSNFSYDIIGHACKLFFKNFSIIWQKTSSTELSKMQLVHSWNIFLSFLIVLKHFSFIFCLLQFLNMTFMFQSRGSLSSDSEFSNPFSHCEETVVSFQSFSIKFWHFSSVYIFRKLYYKSAVEETRSFLESISTQIWTKKTKQSD
jgi:hypothetical protein